MSLVFKIVNLSLAFFRWAFHFASAISSACRVRVRSTRIQHRNRLPVERRNTIHDCPIGEAKKREDGQIGGRLCVAESNAPAHADTATAIESRPQNDNRPKSDKRIVRLFCACCVSRFLPLSVLERGRSAAQFYRLGRFHGDPATNLLLSHVI